MSGVSGSIGTTEELFPPFQSRIQKRRPMERRFRLWPMMRSALARRASQQFGHLFFQSVQGIGGPFDNRGLGWRLARRLSDSGGGPGGSIGLVGLRRRVGGLTGFRLLGCGALKGASKLEAPGGAGGLNRRRGRRRLGGRLGRLRLQNGWRRRSSPG